MGSLAMACRRGHASLYKLEASNTSVTRCSSLASLADTLKIKQWQQSSIKHYTAFMKDVNRLKSKKDEEGRVMLINVIKKSRLMHNALQVSWTGRLLCF